jgi:hypothetical protein
MFFGYMGACCHLNGVAGSRLGKRRLVANHCGLGGGMVE